MVLQASLVMDPAHLISPPRAHPSGSASGSVGTSTLDERHRQQTVVQEPWFMILVATMLLVILFLAAAGMLFFRRRHQITKEIGQLTGGKIEIKFMLACLLLQK